MKSTAVCDRKRTQGNDLLVLVNKSDEHGLAKGWIPENLVSLRKEVMIPGRSISLRRGAALAFYMLADAAREDGFEIRIRSAFRSFATQKKVFRSKVRKYGEHDASRLSAIAGHSQHQLGTTIDVALRRFEWEFTQRLSDTPEGKWLRKNAKHYGFVLSYPKGKEKLTGYAHEPWHYRYIGKQAAAEMHDNKLTLASYLRGCNSCDTDLRCPR